MCGNLHSISYLTRAREIWEKKTGDYRTYSIYCRYWSVPVQQLTPVRPPLSLFLSPSPSFTLPCLPPVPLLSPSHASPSILLHLSLSLLSLSLSLSLSDYTYTIITFTVRCMTLLQCVHRTNVMGEWCTCTIHLESLPLQDHLIDSWVTQKVPRSTLRDHHTTTIYLPPALRYFLPPLTFPLLPIIISSMVESRSQKSANTLQMIRSVVSMKCFLTLSTIYLYLVLEFHIFSFSVLSFFISYLFSLSLIALSLFFIHLF